MENPNKIYYIRLVHHISETDIDFEDDESLEALLDKFHNCVSDDINFGYLGDIELNDINLDAEIEEAALEFVNICYKNYTEFNYKAQLEKLNTLIESLDDNSGEDNL